MKVILTGGTGFIGRALVRHLIGNEKIDHVFVLTRKPLPGGTADNPKVTVITPEDFSSYSSDLMKQLAGAEGCIWALGGRAPQFADLETYRKVQAGFPMAALKAFLADLAPPLAAEGRKFRFVFVSGRYAEWDQAKSLSFMSDTRKVKGEAEKGLCDIADENKNEIEVFVGRPSGVLSGAAGLLKKSVGKLYSAISDDSLAAALTKILLEGYPERIIENEQLLKMG